MATAIKLGDRAFRVEWAYELPVNECGDSLPDEAKYRRVTVTTLKRAREIARAKWSETHKAFGVVEITEVEFVDPYEENIPRTFRWEECGDTEYYEGPEHKGERR